MQQMLDGILEYLMMDTGNDKHEIISLDNVLDEAVSNLRSVLDDSGATIEHEPLPALAVVRSQMEQVFQNLISDAIKFRGPSVPRIRVSVVESTESLRIRFDDNGIGINPTRVGKIVNMFYRIDGETTYPGIGAGLAISRRTVRAHGGDITVESSQGRGSCFILEFRGASVGTISADGGAEEV
jgi:signal transduction histidine kinase